MAIWYYYNSLGKRVLISSAEELKQLAAAGVILPDTIIENEKGYTAKAWKIKSLEFSENTNTKKVVVKPKKLVQPVKDQPAKVQPPKTDKPAEPVKTIKETDVYGIREIKDFITNSTEVSNTPPIIVPSPVAVPEKKRPIRNKSKEGVKIKFEEFYSFCNALQTLFFLCVMLGSILFTVGIFALIVLFGKPEYFFFSLPIFIWCTPAGILFFIWGYTIRVFEIIIRVLLSIDAHTSYQSSVLDDLIDSQ
jgi:hypothetical protein